MTTRIRPCPKCQGRVYLDALDSEWACLHCGYRWPTTPREPLPYVPPGRQDRAGNHAAATPDDAASAKS